jgi:serine/threonine-protein kinase RsbW
MAEIPNVCLSLPSRPENVVVVRHALSGVAECVGLDAVETNDLNTAVTEACNNVVQHAYAANDGPLEVDVHVLVDAIAVVVRDHGCGIDPPMPDGEHDGDARVGLGLPVIAALSRDVELKDRAGGGAEVRMEFAATDTTKLDLEGGVTPATCVEPWSDPANTVSLRLAPNTLARAVLPRVLSALAARAYFSTDRISDVQIVADVLAAKSRHSLSASHLDVGVTVTPRNLELRLGPLRKGRGESLLSAAADGMAPVIARLTDEHHRVQQVDSSAETLQLRLVEHQR